MRNVIIMLVILSMLFMPSCSKKTHETTGDVLPPPADGSIIKTSPYNLNTPGISGYEITYISDKLNITGYLMRPAGNGPFPVIIYNHGNIGGSVEPDALSYLAKSGYVVLASNYRGNHGSEGMEDFGGSDVDDVLNIIKAAKTLNYVDKSRIGMLGVSHGGQMSLLSLSRTSEIKAAAVMFPITDLFSLGAYYEKEDPENPLLKLLQLEVGGTTKSAPSEYRKRSPINYAEQINTPLLILHGEDDRIAPVTQSKMLVQKLKQYDKTYNVKYYKGQGHGFSGAADEDSRKLLTQWFSKYLK